ncbi:MAG: cobaltochelatase subunit CobN, partial [Vicinamibacterales bacterium]
YGAAGLVPAGAPLVGVTFHADNVRLRDFDHLDTLVRALESQGIGAVPVYGWPLSELEPYLTVAGSSPLRMILALNLTIPRQDDVRVLEQLRVRVLNLLVTRESQREWADGAKGLPPDRISPYLNVPERAGATEPILMAASASDSAVALRPVTERVDAIVGRVKRWIALQDLPNAYKRVAILYYNNPPGRGNLGASYLRIFPTIVKVLERMRDEGYATGDSLPDERQLTELLEKGGRNVELWAPGELDALVRDGRATLVPFDTYRRWFAELPQPFRDSVVREWGPPEQARLMAYTAPSGQRFFVVPGVRLGNVFIGPQPLRTTFERALDTTHDRERPVPHAYVAAYLWYRHTFGADAIVHVGRHGTLEWLPGKQVAQSGSDHSEVLLG